MNRAAYIIAQAAALNAHVAGMVAENQKHMQRFGIPKYDEESFNTVAARYLVEHIEVISFLGEGA